MNEVILQEISEFCRQRGLAESTFGRRAVNDGKLASRLRNGGLRLFQAAGERIHVIPIRRARRQRAEDQRTTASWDCSIRTGSRP